jgi:hypothetical protein
MEKPTGSPRGFAARQIGEKAEPLEVIGGSEELVAGGLLQCDEPLIGHEHGALTDIIPPLGGIVPPALIEIAGFGARLHGRVA